MSLWIAFSCFFDFSSFGTSVNLSGTIGRSAKRHFLNLRVVGVGRGEARRDGPTAHVIT